MNLNERGNRQLRSITSEFKTRQEGDEYIIAGYFSVFGSNYEMWPGATESVDSHAFDNALVDDIRCLIDHDTRLVLGRTKAGTLTLRVDEFGLYGEVKINPKDTDAMNLYERVKRGDVDQCSFGFDILDEEFQDLGGGNVHWTIKAVKLWEVSVVTFPAYTETGVSARKDQLAEIKKRQVEVWKQTMGEKLRKENK